MAKQKMDMVVDAKAINYARIASPTAKYMTKGANPLELEWKADLLIDEDTVDAIEKKYPNLRKRLNPITPKKYKATYKVDMPEGVEGPHILKLTMPVAIEFKDKKTGEMKMMEKPQPRLVVSQGDGKAKDQTFDIYVGNNSAGKVILKHRATAYQGSPIDVLELGSIMVTHLVEVDAKPGQGGSQEDDLGDAFGLEEIEESETQAPPRNEPALNTNVADSGDDFGDEPPFGMDDDDTDF